MFVVWVFQKLYIVGISVYIVVRNR